MLFFQNYLNISPPNKTLCVPLDEEINNIYYDNKDKIYIATNNKNVYVLKSGETTPIKIDGIDENIIKIIFDSEKNIYFLDKHNNIFFFKNKLLINSVIKNNNLKKINNNDDETILNTLNYLNRENNYFLNLNKMKIINKTPTSATIVATKGKYRGEVTVNYKIKNKDEISTIHLNDLLEKTVYFDFIDKNFHFLIKLKKWKILILII